MRRSFARLLRRLVTKLDPPSPGNVLNGGRDALDYIRERYGNLSWPPAPGWYSGE